MSSSKRKDKTTLTNKQRQDIITYKSKYPNISNVELVDWVKKEFKLDVHPSTIGRLIKNKEDIGSNPAAKRQRTVQHPELENTLLEWVLQNQERVILSDAILIEKAKTFAQMLEIPDLNLEPDTTLATKRLKGKKKDLERLTLALCANADGTDKIKIFVIGKSPNPRCFKGVNRNGLGVKYDASRKAWMTTILFQKWLKEFDLKMAGPEKDEKMNVLDAIRFIARAWREVTPETIHIEALNFQNIMDLEEYIDYPGEKDTHEVLSDKEILDLATNLEPENESAEDDDSTEMRQISHQEALNVVEILDQYIVQNDFSEITQTEHDEALLKLQKEIRKLRIASFKQSSIETYFELVD
ncbi:20099_t:CDS:2 [Dentiscutata erythropus]|uniref:20099_t:CDS:1 n=1 Tax=Dentiscutata erythropus TaxID=1348616 RepID=A0A9N9HVB8_9GLOM|nr:20099_t:CDS:2 [Dentiscutata erythropus]